ncbi:MAG: TIM barrel protein [Acidobacteria bacterium]|nr:TIM barrel protein [Acidobacteriota bacterium]
MTGLTRRSILTLPAAAFAAGPADLAGQIGVTTATVAAHLRTPTQAGAFSIFELPRVLRDELDLRVIDLNTSTLPSLEPGDLDRLREAAEKAGCTLTNLKINRRDLDLAAPDEASRRHALAEYGLAIDAAARLGCRWARPLPLDARPDFRLYVDGYRRLVERAAPQGVTMLVENWAWLQDDPDAIPRLLDAVGAGVAASPDIGNWSGDAVRREGLAKAFPRAVTCDFKFFDLGPNGEHERYDLRACFEIGWKLGFRGPWCFERANPDRAALFRELAAMRDRLRSWMA